MAYGRGRRLATGAIIGIAIAGFILVAFCVLCCYCCCFRKKRQPRQQTVGGKTSMFSRFTPGKGHGGGPQMMESGHGQGYGHGYHHNIAQPQPAYNYR
ncbi:hypothetical protein K456DRAFT_1764315 [Colletotrichum gloeosporioides 23]|nr:hypothetical protein K456DRAFT_1764315 [Colletotrichum gloeosporioides 23]